MKTLFLIPFFALLAPADGIDEVRIFLNSTEVGNTSVLRNKPLELDLHAGDTLKFNAWTDWGGLDSARVDVVGADGKNITTLSRVPLRSTFNARFWYVVKDTPVNTELRFVLHYNPGLAGHKPWEFVKIIKK